MVVEVEDERRGVDRLPPRTEPALVGAVECEENALIDVVRELAPDLVERHELVLRGQRGVARKEHQGFLAERIEREICCQQRAERVPVRVFMDREKETVVL